MSKLSQVIFFSSFGVWMTRKRREAAWKSRDKVNSKTRALSGDGRRVEQKADEEVQPAVRRSARILERKNRAQGPDYAGRLPDGKEDRKHPKPRQTAAVPVAVQASVYGPLLDHRSASHFSQSTPRHLSASAAAGNQGTGLTQGLGLSSSGGPGMYGF